MGQDKNQEQVVEENTKNRNTKLKAVFSIVPFFYFYFCYLLFLYSKC